MGQAYLLKHSPDVNINRIYVAMLARHDAFKRVWTLAAMLEQLEVQVDTNTNLMGKQVVSALVMVATLVILLPLNSKNEYWIPHWFPF